MDLIYLKKYTSVAQIWMKNGQNVMSGAERGMRNSLMERKKADDGKSEKKTRWQLQS